MKTVLLFILFFVNISQVCASSATSKNVDVLLASETDLFGVVFDIDEWDDSALTWAIPMIEQYVPKLKARFPQIKIAVVSHGDEEFALMIRAKRRYAALHQAIKSLVETDIQFNVCAGHALMNGQSERGFVDFVTPVPAGVVAVAEYKKLGYVYILMEKP